MFAVIAEIIAWIATFFRGAGMLAKNANMVKYLVSIGNLCWFINGAMTSNVPLMVSNGFCLVVMLYEIFKVKIINFFKPVTNFITRIIEFFKKPIGGEEEATENKA